MPEENPNTFFMVSLIIQQLYREILSVADENGGVLKIAVYSSAMNLELCQRLIQPR